MTRVRFLAADGTAVEVDAAPGARLLDVAQDAAQPLEGTCNGVMACGTCHVVLDPADAARLPAPSPDEEDMLDLIRNASRHSRLSCQIVLPAGLDRLTVHVPDPD